MSDLTYEEMLEIAAQRESENQEFGQKPWDESYLEEVEKKAWESVERFFDENDNGLQKLAEIEREERERMDAVRVAIDGIDKYSDALKALAETEKVELQAELEAKKKENFRLVAKYCMQEYEKTYNRDVFPVDEHWVYMVGEYFGTGEGQTTCIMMTQANAGHPEDFETSTNKYVPCTTKEYRAVREFHKQFGTWYLHGLKFLSREDFFGNYAFYIPPMMFKLSNEACYKRFYTHVHYNFA